MIKGFRFTNQLANAEVDAKIHQEILSKNDGIFYGMDLNKTTSSVTVSEGLCEIAGRPVAVIGNETISVSTQSLYNVLVLEIDLSKESTADVFNQVSFKLITSTVNYPTVTQQDINKYNGTNKIYQLEFARFRSGTNGITDFKDTRKFLSFEGVYEQTKKECQTVINEIKQKLNEVENGSAYLLNSNIAIVDGICNIKANSTDTKLNSVISIPYYPEGFTKDNCVVLSIGIKSEDSEESIGYGYGTNCTDNNSPSTILVGTFGKSVVLKEEGMQLRLFFDYGGALGSNKTYKFHFIIILMKRKINNYVYTLGDVNNDGKIDTLDVRKIQSFLEGSTPLINEQIKAADINKDGKVNETDSTKLSQYVGHIVDSLE